MPKLFDRRVCKGNWLELLGVSKELEFLSDQSMSSVNSSFKDELRWATQNGDVSEVERIFIESVSMQ